MKNRIAIVSIFGLLIAFGLAAYLMIGTEGSGASERQRREAFERHAAISEQARHQFDRAYGEFLRADCTPESLAQHFGLLEAPQRIRRTNGGYEVRIELPREHSRLIMMWSNDDKRNGYAWEIMTPASNNVSWKQHLAAQSG